MSDLDVDGTRPAVARVAALPRTYRLTPAERLVLLALACDSFDGIETAPGYENLAAWTGLHRSSVAEVVARLVKPTDRRPALLERAETTRGRHRTTFRLLLGGGQSEDEPSGQGDRLATPDGWAGEPSANRPAAPDGWGEQPSGEPSGQPSGEPSGHAGHLPYPYPPPSSSVGNSPGAREDVDGASRNAGDDDSAAVDGSPAEHITADRDNNPASPVAALEHATLAVRRGQRPEPIAMQAALAVQSRVGAPLPLAVLAEHLGGDLPAAALAVATWEADSVALVDVAGTVCSVDHALVPRGGEHV